MADRQQVEYQGVTYDMPAGLSNEEYLGKIQAHLGQTPEPAIQEDTAPAPVGEKSQPDQRPTTRSDEDIVTDPMGDTISDLPNMVGGMFADAAKKFYNSPSKFLMTNLARPSAAATTGGKRALEGGDVMEGVRKAWNNPETQEFMSDVAMEKMVEKGMPIPLAAGIATAGQLGELIALDPLNVTGAGLAKSVAKLNKSRKAMEVGGAQGQAAMRESAKVADQQAQQIVKPQGTFQTRLGRELAESLGENPTDMVDLAADAKLSRLDKPGLANTKAKAGEMIAEKLSEGVPEHVAKTQVASKLGLPKTTVYDTLNKEATTTKGFLGIKKLFTPISSRVRDGAPKLWWRERVTDIQAAEEIADYTTRMKLADTQMGKLSGKTKQRVEHALVHRNWAPIEDILSKRPKLREGLLELRKVLDELGDKQQAVGYEFNRLDNYIPIKVKDLDGLIKSDGGKGAGGRLGSMERTAIAKKGGRPLTKDELAKLYRDASVNDLSTALGKPGHLKERTKDAYRPDQMKFLDDSISSVRDYIDDAVTNLQRQRMFGGKYGDELNNDSIGRLIADEMEAGHMDPKVIDEAAELLRVRYIEGEKPGNKLINTTKNILYGQVLGQPTSGLRQTGDVFLAMQREGVRNTMGAVSDVLTRRGITREDVGVNNITREIGKQGFTGRMVDRIFTLNGMKTLDGFGKNVRLNAAHRLFKKQVKSRRGLEKLGAEFQGAMPQDEFVKLVQDLRAGKTWRESDQIKQVVTSRLYDAQPISTSEMPEIWAKHPNGRIMYSLLSFTLKTFDNTMREARLSMRSGQNIRNKIRGAKTLALGAAWLAAANTPADMIIDYVRGRDVKLTPEDAGWNMLQLVGISKWAKDNVTGGKAAEIVPAIGWLNKNFKNASEFAQALASEDKDVDWNRMVSGVPIVGRFLYDHKLGGAEKYREWQEKQED